MLRNLTGRVTRKRSASNTNTSDPSLPAKARADASANRLTTGGGPTGRQWLPPLEPGDAGHEAEPGDDGISPAIGAYNSPASIIWSSSSV